VPRFSRSQPCEGQGPQALSGIFARGCSHPINVGVYGDEGYGLPLQVCQDLMAVIGSPPRACRPVSDNRPADSEKAPLDSRFLLMGRLYAAGRGPAVRHRSPRLQKTPGEGTGALVCRAI